jgi:hypothetical protein
MTHRNDYVRHDAGGWISGPAADAVPASQIRADDVVIVGPASGRVESVEAAQFIDDATGTTVTGIAIWWRGENSRGVLRRRDGDLVQRAQQTPGQPQRP